jgi:hypothetical protein
MNKARYTKKAASRSTQKKERWQRAERGNSCRPSNLALQPSRAQSGATRARVRREGDMKSGSVILVAAAALCAPATAHAAALTVVEVGAPAVNCVFNSSCTVVVNDSVGTLQYTPLGNGAFLQSRSYPGQPGTPGAGATAYEYRVDLTQATDFTECLAGLVVDFGPVKKLTYPTNQPGDVFVTTQGGIGSVGIKSAEQDGTVIVFSFSKYLCAGQTSYFFGMAATTAPQAGSATLFGFGSPPFVQTSVRAPQH